MAAVVNKEDAPEGSYQRNLLCRLVFAFIFCCLLYYQYSHTLVHQLQSPVLKFPNVDLTYWVFHLTRLPELITANFIASFLFDVLLFTFCLLSLFFPGKRIFIMLFSVLYAVYYITFNSYGGHHTHSKIGILLMPVPFLFTGKKFLYMWEAARYYALFMYADAFLWKLLRLTFLHTDQGILIIKRNLAAFLYYNKASFSGGLYTWLLLHPLFVQWLFFAGFIAEGFFLVGFFTRRLDKLLLITSLLLPCGFLLLSDAFFFELLIFSFTFIPMRMFSPRHISAV